MKTLFLGLIVACSMAKAPTSSETLSHNQDHQMEDLLGTPYEPMISIYDLEGNLVDEYSRERFIENTLPIGDLIRIMESDFMFEYQGNSYYLKS